MRARPILSLAALLLASAAQAGGFTVDRLTCLQAQDFVIQHGRYYKASFDGPLPIYPVMPVNADPVCKGRERVHYVIERTSDLAECLLGYQCVSQ